jgi:Uma2 family endonuclease
MGATTTLVTVQEFLRLPEPDGQRIELIGGEVVTMGRGALPHEAAKKNLIRMLVLWLADHPLGEVWSETTFQLDEFNAPIPDVSVLFPGRISPGSTWIQGAPEIAIEIVSSESAATLEKKIELYLSHGGKSVWVVFPEHRVVRIFDTAGQARMFERHQILEDPNVLPGFSVPVSALFEVI